MVYKTNSAPYQRTKKSTLQIMIELGIALAIVWIAAVITTFMKLGNELGLKSILLILPIIYFFISVFSYFFEL